MEGTSWPRTLATSLADATTVDREDRPTLLSGVKAKHEMLAGEGVGEWVPGRILGETSFG